jgi:ribosomal protein L6P/L9E
LRSGSISQRKVSDGVANGDVVVTVEIKTRRVKVKGPRGEITKSFRHMPCELSIVKQQTRTRKGQYVNVKMWFGGSKQSCSVSTLKSLIRNMITGVTKVSKSIYSQLSYFLLLYNYN